MAVFRASDGSIHTERWRAEARDAEIREQAPFNALKWMLEDIMAARYFRSLTDSIAPMGSNEWEATRDERDDFVGELTNLIFEKWTEMEQIVANPANLKQAAKAFLDDPSPENRKRLEDLI